MKTANTTRTPISIFIYVFYSHDNGYYKVRGENEYTVGVWSPAVTPHWLPPPPPPPNPATTKQRCHQWPKNNLVLIYSYYFVAGWTFFQMGFIYGQIRVLIVKSSDSVLPRANPQPPTVVPLAIGTSLPTRFVLWVFHVIQNKRGGMSLIFR